uniref:Uncharacterized protein n=1 Tax=Macaca nemestrina TaxID=9545 RepID=A0A2K6BV89_MACNE
MDSIHPQRCACNSWIRPRWDCMAHCILQGEASGGAGTVSLTPSQPRERGPAGERGLCERNEKGEGFRGRGAWWQSQRLVSPGKHDRVSMHSKSQSVFTGVSAGDKQFTTTFSIVFTI